MEKQLGSAAYVHCTDCSAFQLKRITVALGSEFQDY
jgi:hypothetical protein